MKFIYAILMLTILFSCKQDPQSHIIRLDKTDLLIVTSLAMICVLFVFVVYLEDTYQKRQNKNNKR